MLNVFNLEKSLLTKTLSTTSDLLYASKTLKQLGLSNVNVVSNYADLPSITSLSLTGALYLVQNQNTIYFSNGNAWVPLNTTSENTAWSWGSNGNVALGNNLSWPYDRSSPGRVVGGLAFSKVSLSCRGIIRALAIEQGTKTIWFWGSASSGSSGTNKFTETNISSPISIIGNLQWKDVYAANRTSLAIKTDDTLWTWGDNNYGQLGDNTTVAKSSPISVIGGFTWKAIGGGYGHSCAIRADNTVWIWGANNYGQIGDNTTVSKSSPVSTIGGFTWTAITCGQYSTHAIKSDGTLWSWGRNNYGQLGDNTTVAKSSPISVIGGFTWKAVSAGGYNSVAAIKSDSTLWGWGSNGFGQIGDGTVTNRSSPVSVVGGFTWSVVANTTTRTVAIKSDGTLWAWGKNNYGQLGDNTTVNKSSPISVIGGFNNWVSISLSKETSIGIRATST